MNPSRRRFLKSTGLGFLALGLPPAFLVRAAEAQQTGKGKVMVVVFQRGAMDGLNAVIPFKDRAYYTLRPSIAIPEPASGEDRVIDLDGFYGLHPALAPLKNIYDKGHLATFKQPDHPTTRAPISMLRTIWKSALQELKAHPMAGSIGTSPRGKR